MAKESIDKAQLKWHAEDLEDFQSISISGENTLLPNERLERLQIASKYIVDAIKDGDLVLADYEEEIVPLETSSEKNEDDEEILNRTREIREALGETSSMRETLDYVMNELSEINAIDVTTVSDALKGLKKIESFLEKIDPSDES